MLCLSVFVCVYVCTMCMQYPWRPEEGIRSPGTEVTRSYEPMRVLGMEPGSSAGVANALKCPTIFPDPHGKKVEPKKKKALKDTNEVTAF